MFKPVKFMSLALAVVLFCTAAITSIPALAAVQSDDDGICEVSEVSDVTIQSVSTGEFMNFDFSILKQKNPIRCWPFDSTIEQRWNIVKVAENTYRLVTSKSSKYCLDFYRYSYSNPLRTNLKCNIWETGADPTAQNLIFYRCGDAYILCMKADPSLAISSAGKGQQLKLAKFNPSSNAQKWRFCSSSGAPIDISSNETDTTKAENLTKKTFVFPLISKFQTNYITQDFGAWYSKYGFHLGTDMGTANNKTTTVVAITDGIVYRVVAAKNSGGWGTLIILQHRTSAGKIFYTGYAHLQSKVNVSAGDVVSAGDKLGTMGNSGISTAPHLHLMVFSGPFSKNSLPKGYTTGKITGNSHKVGKLTYYDPIEVITLQGSNII